MYWVLAGSPGTHAGPVIYSNRAPNRRQCGLLEIKQDLAVEGLGHAEGPGQIQSPGIRNPRGNV